MIDIYGLTAQWARGAKDALNWGVFYGLVHHAAKRAEQALEQGEAA